MNRRQIILILVLVGLLLLVVLWTNGQCNQAAQAAKNAQKDLATCQNASLQIKSLRHRPDRAKDSGDMRSQITGLIESQAQKLRIPKSAIVRINHLAPQRMGDSPYKCKPTRVLLQNVTLKQVSDLARALRDGEQNLLPQSVLVSAPDRRDTGNAWSAELTVTYLVYAPPKQTH